MPSLAELTDAADLDAMRTALAAADPDDRLVPLDLRRVAVGDVVGEVARHVSEALSRAGRPTDRARVVVLADAVPYRRRGEDLKAKVVHLLDARFDVVRATLVGHRPLHADDDAIAQAARAVQGADAVVTVGGGTVTDIGKVVTAATGQPLVVVQSAASVDGFTDNVSVVLRDGVKRTIPSRWPDVVLADVPTVLEAPAHLNAAGYGEVLSMHTAPADWYLATLAGVDDSFHPAPRDLLVTFGASMADWSAGVGAGDPASVEQLTRMLVVRGVATGVAGSTACLSGVEHLVSHMLDLHHGERGLPTGLHGAQVGVASVVAAAAWELLLDRLDPAVNDLDALLAEDAGTRPEDVPAVFTALDPTGRVGAECARDFAAKDARWQAARPHVESLLRDWARHRDTFRRMLPGAAALGTGLRAAGVPARFDELDPAVDGGLARWAVSHCHLMRDRFTVVDLLDRLGWWDEATVTQVLAAAEAATARDVLVAT